MESSFFCLISFFSDSKLVGSTVGDFEVEAFCLLSWSINLRYVFISLLGLAGSFGLYCSTNFSHYGNLYEQIMEDNEEDELFPEDVESDPNVMEG